jgi:hypothetical protein
LQLEEYDKMCGEKRKYYSVRELARKQRLSIKRRKTIQDKKSVNSNLWKIRQVR